MLVLVLSILNNTGSTRAQQAYLRHSSTSTIDREAKLFSASHAAAGGVYSHHKQNKKRACFLTFGKERRTMVRTLDLDESRR